MSPGVSSLYWLDVHHVSTAARAELHLACDKREQSIVATSAHTLTGVEVGATLPNQDLTRVDLLATEALHTEALRIGITTIARAGRALLVCHLPYLSLRFR